MSTGEFTAAIRRWRPAVRLLLTCFLALWSHCAAQAQVGDSASPDSSQIKQASDQSSLDSAIIVTGSRVPRKNLTATSPVTVIDGREVQLQGAVRTEQLINSLPQAAPDQGSHISAGATGTATVDLRGLGPSRTLVLINGRRMLPGDATYPAPDINAVPSALIKRVEVLTGGASSVYGSDALVGVVNFILETDLDGLRVEGQSSIFQHDNRDGANLRQALIRADIDFPVGNNVDGATQDINGAFGTSFADGSGHAVVYAGYRHISAVTEDARDYSACATQGRLDSNIFDCGGSIASATGTFETLQVGPFQVGSSRVFVPGTTLFNFAPFNYYQRPGRRYVAGGFADFEFSLTLQPFVEAMFMDDRSTAQIAPSALFGELDNINCDNPLLSVQQLSLVCVDGNFVGQERGGNPTQFVDPVTGANYLRGFLFTERRNAEGGPRRWELRHKNLRLLGGIRGEVAPGATYEATILFGKVSSRSESSNNLAVSHIARALDVIADPATGRPACRSMLTGEDLACVPWDIFAPGTVTPEAVSYLVVPTIERGTVKQLVATAFSTMSAEDWGIRSPWANESPVLNVGGEYRKDTLSYRPDETLRSGDIGGEAVLPVSGSTEAKDLFGEIRIPLIANQTISSFALEGGYRRTWQSNPQNRFRVSSSKLALEFAPIADIRFRASLQHAVRAPNVQELFAPVISSGFFRQDPCAGPNPAPTIEQCAFSGVTPQQYGHIAPRPFGIPNNTIFGGNPALDAERAKTRTIGLVLRPRFIPGLSATIDWFDIAIKGMVSQNGPTVILNSCIQTGEAFFCDRVHRDANGSLWQTNEGYVDNRNVNVAKGTARGVDVGISYFRATGHGGSVELDFLGSWLASQKTDPGGLASPQECAGTYGLGCGVPKPSWRHKARGTWSPSGQISMSLQWRYYGRVTLDRSIPGNLNIAGPWRPGDERIGAQNFFDVTFLAQTSSRYEFRLGVQNIFDREPPIVSSTGEDPAGACTETVCNGNTFPQVYDPLGRYLFAGITINLGAGR